MKILIADDHPLTLQGTVSFVESYGYKVSYICSNGTSALNLIKLHQPDVAILDINMPGMDGIEIAREIFEIKLATKIILLTMHNEKTLFNKAMEYSVFGYILKEHAITELEKCLAAMRDGIPYVSEIQGKEFVNNTNKDSSDLARLTFSERKVVELIAQQKTTKQIAELLFLSEKAIENHSVNIIQKLGLPKEEDILLKWAMRKQLYN